MPLNLITEDQLTSLLTVANNAAVTTLTLLPSLTTIITSVVTTYAAAIADHCRAAIAATVT